MTDERNDKAVEEERPKAKKPPGYRAFEKLLRRVVNAPPMNKKKGDPPLTAESSMEMGNKALQS